MKGNWIRKPQADTALVFAHGILSSGESAWQHENGNYWPQILEDEPELPEIGIYVFSYRTGIFSGGYDLGDSVDALKTHLRLDEALDCRRLIFVCHSMDGIVVRKFLVDQQTDSRQGD